ncbi:LOG family protein [Candidatus Saccharibacteria bacterium]|nr:LOG family protein [Candidatus Saccharibacteria bacterium]
MKIKGGRYQICVSGAAKGESVEQGRELASEAGKAIAKARHTLLTGATSGLPEQAASSYKSAGGLMSLGISPAATKIEHVVKYRLPVNQYDCILYTGLHYIGRDTLLINSADAVVSIGGRLGTLHEFTIAMETRTPIGFLQGAGGISNEIEEFLEFLPNAHKELVLFDTDADRLVAKLSSLLDELYEPYASVYK